MLTGYNANLETYMIRDLKETYKNLNIYIQCSVILAKHLIIRKFLNKYILLCIVHIMINENMKQNSTIYVNLFSIVKMQLFLSFNYILN